MINRTVNKAVIGGFISILFIAVAFFASISSVSATDKLCVWTGDVDSKWSTPGNWSNCTDNGGVPGNNDWINLPASANNKAMNNDLAADLPLDSFRWMVQAIVCMVLILNYLVLLQSQLVRVSLSTTISILRRLVLV